MPTAGPTVSLPVFHVLTWSGGLEMASHPVHSFRIQRPSSPLSSSEYHPLHIEEINDS